MSGTIKIKDVPAKACKALCAAWHDTSYGGWCGADRDCGNPERICTYPGIEEEIERWRTRQKPSRRSTADLKPATLSGPGRG